MVAYKALPRLMFEIFKIWVHSLTSHQVLNDGKYGLDKNFHFHPHIKPHFSSLLHIHDLRVGCCILLVFKILNLTFFYVCFPFLLFIGLPFSLRFFYLETSLIPNLYRIFTKIIIRLSGFSVRLLFLTAPYTIIIIGLYYIKHSNNKLKAN